LGIRRYTFRLYPNKVQETKLFEARRIHAYLYNACVAHRRYEWKANQKTVTYFERMSEKFLRGDFNHASCLSIKRIIAM
jgi:putative transposase